MVRGGGFSELCVGERGSLGGGEFGSARLCAAGLCGSGWGIGVFEKTCGSEPRSDEAGFAGDGVSFAAGFFGLDGVGVRGDGGGGDGVDEGEGFFEDGAGASLAGCGAEVLDAVEEGEKGVGGVFDVGLAEPEEEGHEGLLSRVGVWRFRHHLAEVEATVEDGFEELAVGIGEVSDW